MDPLFVILLGIVGLLLFFGFLLLRRTLLGFREGYDKGKR